MAMVETSLKSLVIQSDNAQIEAVAMESLITNNLLFTNLLPHIQNKEKWKEDCVNSQRY